MAGSCASCSPAPRRRREKGRELQSVLSRASTIQWPGDAIRALPRLDDIMAGSCASRSPAPRRRREKGRELRFVLSRASTHDETKAGSGASSSPALRRLNGRELCLLLSRASTIQMLGAALRALPRLDVVRSTRQWLGAVLRAFPSRDDVKAGTCDSCSPVPRRCTTLMTMHASADRSRR
jgi:hypothetical protein